MNAISWKQFLEGIAGLCIAYYAVFILLYYRKELKAVLTRKQQIAPERPSTGTSTNHDALMPQVHELVTGIKNILYAASSQQYAWNETLFALQQLLKEYPQLKASRYTISINNEINFLSAEILSTPMTEDEVQALWA